MGSQHDGKEKKTSDLTCRSFLFSAKVNPSVSTPGPLPLPESSGLSDELKFDKKKSFAPMTQEEYTKMRNTIRRVVDPETGRSRLIRGEGEILEEIVSRERHKEINKVATRGDGDWFQQRLKHIL